MLIRDDETVTVRVVDQVGRPLANVPVGIQQRIPQRRQNPKAQSETLRLLLGGRNTRTQGKDGQKKEKLTRDQMVRVLASESFPVAAALMMPSEPTQGWR